MGDPEQTKALTICCQKLQLHLCDIACGCAQDCARHSREIAEASSAHTNGDKVERACLHTDFLKR